MRATNRPAATPSQTVIKIVGQPPNCSTSDGSVSTTLLSSIGSVAIWVVISRGERSIVTGRSTVCVKVGMSSRAAGISHKP